MNLLKAKVENFGSYDNLEYEFHNQGLALIYGATGSGKSTLQDIPTWILFGQTAKDGNADDVRSWNSEEPTKGELQIEIRESKITITRIRGRTGQNDLYWDESGQIHRGKDISETQILLNNRIGVDYYTYITGAYYNEFSPTGQFFISKASDRRKLLESLVDLSLPTLLNDRISQVKKQDKVIFIELSGKYNKIEGKLDQLRRHKISLEKDINLWKDRQLIVIEELQIRAQKFGEEIDSKIEVCKLKAQHFEITRQKSIEKYKTDLQRKIDKFAKDKKCPSCGVVRDKDEIELLEINQDYKHLINQEQLSINPYNNEQETIKNQENPYFERITVELKRSNPYLDQMISTEKELITTSFQYKELKNHIDILVHKLNSLDQLRKFIEKLREELCKNTLRRLELETNRYLETYFDSEIRVVFELTAGDKLDVRIWKSGNECSYKQLSKGQRSLLKLTFSISSMKLISDKCGVHFNCLMFDEPADGADTDLKIKAYRLFEELALSHDTILVIDHNESLQNMFDCKYNVIMKDDKSYINRI